MNDLNEVIFDKHTNKELIDILSVSDIDIKDFVGYYNLLSEDLKRSFCERAKTFIDKDDVEIILENRKYVYKFN